MDYIDRLVTIGYIDSLVTIDYTLLKMKCYFLNGAVKI